MTLQNPCQAARRCQGAVAPSSSPRSRHAITGTRTDATHHDPPRAAPPATAPLLPEGGRGRTDQRIELDRAARKISVPQRAALGRRRAAALLVACDAAVTAISLITMPFLTWDVRSDGPVTWLFVLGAALGTFLAGGYRLERGSGRLAAVGTAGGLAATWLLLKYLSKKEAIRPLSPPGAQGMVALAALLVLWVVASRVLSSRLLRRTEARARLFFIGTAAAADAMRERLAAGGQTSTLVWFDPTLPSDAATPDALGPLPLAAFDARMQGAVRAVVLATSADALPRQTVADLIHCRILNVPVLTPSQYIEDAQERIPLSADDYGWFLHDEKLHGGASLLYASGKRVFDIVGALVGLVLASPILVTAGVLVKATSRGPVFYRQTRVGRWKRPFTLYKIRTMRVDAEASGVQWASTNDPRVTKLGRFLRRTRMDELPQLWNVLIGQMSLVGPRPERPEFTAELEHLIPYYDLRHLVKPGVTGWAQVCFPYGASVEHAIAKLEYDVYYIKYASWAFDARVLLRTVGVVLTGRGS